MKLHARNVQSCDSVVARAASDSNPAAYWGGRKPVSCNDISLAKVLQYHVIYGRYTLAIIAMAPTRSSLSSATIYLSAKLQNSRRSLLVPLSYSVTRLKFQWTSFRIMIIMVSM